MRIKHFLKFSLVVVLISSIWSCDDEFMETGSGLINSIELPPLYETENLITYSERIRKVQANNFALHTLADFQDPVFGNFKSSLLTQLQLGATNPDFGTGPQLDSVVLTLPFFNRLTETDVYTLDSVSGNGDFRIKIFKSNHFLRSLNPGGDGDFTENQIYYSDDFSTFQPNIENTPLVDEGPFNFDDFTTPLELIQRSDADAIDTLTVAPRIRIKLPNDFFEENIIAKEGQPELASNGNFANFLRGFHIVMEKVGGEGASALFNLQAEDANITLHYQTQRPAPSLDPDSEPVLQDVWNRFRLTFTGIKVSLFEDDFAIDVDSPNLENGEENIYLKGGNGYFAVIELFTGADSDDDGISDELEHLRNRNVLINEANLEFFVNEELATSRDNRINRILLFNLDDNTILQDYVNDRTASDFASTSRISHLGPLSQNNGVRSYRLRITDHINQLINQDSTNIKLGLMITDNVNATNQIEAETSDDNIDRIFRQSAQFTKGTVLHGSNSPNEEKRIKLKIQLTEIN